MNWYKKSQQMTKMNKMNLDGIEPLPSFDFDVYDYHDMYLEHLSDIIDTFKSGGQLTWDPVSMNKLKPVYRHFTTRNYLDYRDVKSLYEIIRDVISNVARLDASTALCGHGVNLLENLFEQVGETIENEEEKEKFLDYIEWQGQCPISEYGLPKLHTIIQKMPQHNNNPRQLLVLLSQMLDVIHLRNDLASWLIEGGSDSLLELSNLE